METHPDLQLYLQNRTGAVAHIVRQYPDGNIYIFCNRYYGTASGRLFTAEDAETPAYSSTVICPKCCLAVETALERSAVIAGLPPPEKQ